MKMKHPVWFSVALLVLIACGKKDESISTAPNSAPAAITPSADSSAGATRPAEAPSAASPTMPPTSATLGTPPMPEPNAPAEGQAAPDAPQSDTAARQSTSGPKPGQTNISPAADADNAK